MATTRELTRATAPLGFFEPRLFGPRWLKEFDRFFEDAASCPEMEVFEKNNLLTVRWTCLAEEGGADRARRRRRPDGGGRAEARNGGGEEPLVPQGADLRQFYRTVPLPEGVNAKEVKATFRHGVLEVTVPVRAVADPAPHKVEVHEPEEKVTVAA
jgi:HSP20 family molecular chaperone IbpA